MPYNRNKLPGSPATTIGYPEESNCGVVSASFITKISIHITDVKNVMLAYALWHTLGIITLKLICEDSTLV
jgi:hypothetical protein